ncbi:MAG TPA: DUF6510 family protein [Gemmatimonadaceae bacterium]|nr:DUF6510 family protein [Gemmatimonadaceae bacterium]
MSEDGIRLDGNAAAGPLSEAFAAEMTTAIGTCAGCGARAALGTTHVYTGGPGTVLRCSSCESVLIRFARIRGTLNVEMRGVRRVELHPPQ